jgi:hypothetical protein
MIYSFDGINWYPCTGDVLTYNPIISSILFNGSTFIAIAYKLGVSGNLPYSSPQNTGTVTATADGRVIYTSIDGIRWSTKLLTNATTGPGAYLLDTISASSTTVTNGRNDTTPYIPQTIPSVNTIQNNQSSYYVNSFWLMSTPTAAYLRFNTEYDNPVYINNPTANINIAGSIVDNNQFAYSLQHTSDGRLCIAYPKDSTLTYYYTYDAGNSWYQSKSLSAVTWNANIIAITWDFTDSYWYTYIGCFVYRAIDGMTWIFYSNTNIMSFIIQKIDSAATSLKSPLTIGLDANGKRMIFSSYSSKLYYSYDHSIWYSCTGYNTLNTGNANPQMIIYFNSIWVTSISANAGNDTIAYSSDGLTWRSVINSSTIINPSLFATNGLVIIASNVTSGFSNIGVRAYSYDAINWNIANTYGINLSDIFYTGSCFVGIGFSLPSTLIGAIITSFDGIYWVYNSTYNGINFGVNMGGGSLFNSRSAIKPAYLPSPRGTTVSPKLILNDINVSGGTTTIPNNASSNIYISSPFTSPFVVGGVVQYTNRFSIYLNISFNTTSTAPSVPITLYYTLAIGQANNLNYNSTTLYSVATGQTQQSNLNAMTLAGAKAMGFIIVKQGNYTKSISMNITSTNTSSNPWYVYLLMIASNNNVITVNSPKISCQVINRPSLT